MTDRLSSFADRIISVRPETFFVRYWDEHALAGEASCSNLLQRTTAARGAINGPMAEVLQEHVREYLSPVAMPIRSKLMRPRSSSRSSTPR
jgi:hypothetical protein